MGEANNDLAAAGAAVAVAVAVVATAADDDAELRAELQRVADGSIGSDTSGVAGTLRRLGTWAKTPAKSRTMAAANGVVPFCVAALEHHETAAEAMRVLANVAAEPSAAATLSSSSELLIAVVKTLEPTTARRNDQQLRTRALRFLVNVASSGSDAKTRLATTNGLIKAVCATTQNEPNALAQDARLVAMLLSSLSRARGARGAVIEAIPTLITLALRLGEHPVSAHASAAAALAPASPQTPDLVWATLTTLATLRDARDALMADATVAATVDATRNTNLSREARLFAMKALSSLAAVDANAVRLASFPKLAATAVDLVANVARPSPPSSPTQQQQQQQPPPPPTAPSLTAPPAQQPPPRNPDSPNGSTARESNNSRSMSSSASSTSSRGRKSSPLREESLKMLGTLAAVPGVPMTLVREAPGLMDAALAAVGSVSPVAPSNPKDWAVVEAAFRLLVNLSVAPTLLRQLLDSPSLFAAVSVTVSSSAALAQTARARALRLLVNLAAPLETKARLFAAPGVTRVAVDAALDPLAAPHTKFLALRLLKSLAVEMSNREPLARDDRLLEAIVVGLAVPTSREALSRPPLPLGKSEEASSAAAWLLSSLAATPSLIVPIVAHPGLMDAVITYASPGSQSPIDTRCHLLEFTLAFVQLRATLMRQEGASGRRSTSASNALAAGAAPGASKGVVVNGPLPSGLVTLAADSVVVGCPDSSIVMELSFCLLEATNNASAWARPDVVDATLAALESGREDWSVRCASASLLLSMVRSADVHVLGTLRRARAVDVLETTLRDVRSGGHMSGSNVDTHNNNNNGHGASGSEEKVSHVRSLTEELRSLLATALVELSPGNSVGYEVLQHQASGSRLAVFGAANAGSGPTTQQQRQTLVRPSRGGGATRATGGTIASGVGTASTQAAASASCAGSCSRRALALCWGTTDRGASVPPAR